MLAVAYGNLAAALNPTSVGDVRGLLPVLAVVLRTSTLSFLGVGYDNMIPTLNSEPAPQLQELTHLG